MSAIAGDPADSLDPEELRETARRLFADKVDRRAGWSEGRALDTGTLEAELADLGWLLLTAPTEYGGLGQSFLALAPVYEEIGRSLSPVTIADTMAALDVLAAGEGATAAEVLKGIVAQKLRVTLGFLPTLDRAAVDGKVVNVWGASSATHLLLLPQSGQGLVLLADARAAGVRIERVETWDRGRAFADITLSGALGRPLTIGTEAAARIARAHIDLAVAWDSVGAARQALVEAVAYMGTRRQFGRSIGSFQALKHRAADLKVGLELAHALARRASEAYARRTPGWSDLAGQARLLAVDSYRAIAEESVQFHGGIGFTWEHDCHLFLKRALMNEVLGDTPERVRDRVAAGIFRRAFAPD